MLFFIIGISIGTFFLILSLYFLPFLVISPSKFAGCFLFGSISCIYGIGELKGWKKFLVFLVTKERRWISLMYIITLLLTVYYALI